MLKPHGFVFAPYPTVTDTDRDKYCVQRILGFYQHHKVDLADYFLAAWKYRHRDPIGRPHDELVQFAAEAGLSAKYLALLWSALSEAGADAGPLAAVRQAWRDLPRGVDTARPGCERLRDLVLRMRKQLRPEVKKVSVNGISAGSQPLVLWHNRQLAQRHRAYSGQVLPDLRKLAEQCEEADAPLAAVVLPKETNAATEPRLRGAGALLLCLSRDLRRD